MMKDNIEVGEYIRTKNGYIRKIEKVIEKDNYFTVDHTYFNEEIQENTKGIILEEDVLKHSKNIIDLIEIGDIVRVYMEDDVEADGVYEDTNMFEVIGVTTDGLEVVLLGKGFILEFFPKENIRGIVTKEQIEEMEYRV